jgi:hypothetical protein
VNEWFIFLVIAVPALSYLLGVWAASEAERRAFARFVNRFDEVTRDHREKTPKVRMTLYRRLIERTRRTQKIHAPPVPERVALNRKYVFLNLKPPDETARGDTLRMRQDEQITLRMRR